MKNKTLLFTLLFIFLVNLGCAQKKIDTNKDMKQTPTANLYSFKVKDIDGKEFSLSALKGKKVMIVNVASKCGNTHQYSDLEKLYQAYKDSNFIIIGFPANNFLGQEPGTNEQIKQFCTANYGVTFPMMAKISVKGSDIAPIYQWLTKKSENGRIDAKVSWNFQKFLIDENGNVVDFISPRESVLSDKVKNWIEESSASYKEWNKEAESNIRLLPKYGNIPKTKEQKQADQKLITQYIIQDGSKEKASENLINIGFNYLSNKDIKTAMYRFNQAWLLNPKNESVFLGFGVVYFTHGDLDKALYQFEEGLSMNPKNSHLLTNKAIIYLSKYERNQDKTYLNTANDLLLTSYKLEKNNPYTLSKLSESYLLNNDCSLALKYYNECLNLDDQIIIPKLKEMITLQCKD